MKFHPDVNKAPGATEAFKNIGSAYSCLKDKQKRSNYDRFGSEDGPQRQTTTRPFYSQRGFYQQGDEDIDEIFRAFFGGGAGGSMFQNRGNPFFSRRQRRQRREEQEEQTQEDQQTGSIFSFILQMLPIFLIFILPSIVSFIASEGNKGSFSLDRTNSFSVRRTTKVFFSRKLTSGWRC
jgi:curved DNA-binding protein CbpA